MNESGLEKKVLAFDFGASSGRAIIGTFDGNRIYIKETEHFKQHRRNIHKRACEIFDADCRTGII